MFILRKYWGDGHGTLYPKIIMYPKNENKKKTEEQMLFSVGNN